MALKSFTVRNVAWTGIFFFLAMCWSSGLSQIFNGYLEIPRLAVQPVIDGTMDPGEWKGAVYHTGFTVWTLDRYIPEKTEVWMGHDDRHVYLFFKGCFLDKKLFDDFIEDHKPIDSHLWGRTHFGVALSCQAASIRVKCGPTLSRMDFRNGDLSWNGAWDFKAVVQDDHWTGEYAIPFSDFGLDRAPVGEECSLSLEHCNPSGESSHWSGLVRFVEDKDMYVEFKPWPGPEPGLNELPVRLQNMGPETLKARCRIQLIPFTGYPEFVGQTGQGNSPGMVLGLKDKPLISETILEVGGGETREASLVFDLPKEGNYYAGVDCRDENGRTIRQVQGHWFTLVPNQRRLLEAEKKLGEGLSMIRELTEPERGCLSDHASRIRSVLDQKRKSVPLYWENREWDLLTVAVDSLEKSIARFLHTARLASRGTYQPGDAFGIATAQSIHKFRRDAAFPGQLTGHISLSGARNEYESFQLVILPLEGDLTGMGVRASDLYSMDGGMIPQANIEIALVEYNLINWQANYVNERQGWHPDPLIPVDGPFQLPGSDLCRPLWITVYIPEDARPGQYRGQIVVSANETEQHRVAVELRVWDFQLPVESHLKTHTWDDIGTFEDFYGVKPMPVDWYMNFCNTLLKNRLNPSFAGTNYLDRSPAEGKYDFSTVEKVLDYAISKGMSRFSLIQMKKGAYQADELKAELQFIEAYAGFLQEKGWLDRALVEIWDEPTVLQWRQVRERAEMIKAISPDIRLQLFAGGSDPYLFWEPSVSAKYGLLDLIDIWAPHLLVNAPELQQKGKEIWTYFCTLARSNAPNFYIDAPALYQRVIPWYCWMHGVDGFEHWSTTYFWRNRHEGMPVEKKWPALLWDSRTFHDFHGEGQLIYPGPRGSIYPSLRLEIFRDGMEDYEYLYRLRELLDTEAVTGTADALLQRADELLKLEEYLLIRYPHDVQITLENTPRYPDRPELILETREEIARLIETLQANQLH